MKAQMKAIMASAVVIALCLAAVGGVTYSWFSDTEESNITVNAAEIDLNLSDISGNLKSVGIGSSALMPTGGQFPLGGTVSFGTITSDDDSTTYTIIIDQIAPGDSLDLILSGTLKNTIRTSVSTSAIITEDDLPYTGTMLTIATPTCTILNEGVSVANLNDVPASSDNKYVTVTTTIALDKLAGNEYQERQFKIELTVTAMQLNYEAPNQVTINNPSVATPITYDNESNLDVTFAANEFNSGNVVTLDVETSDIVESTSDYSFLITENSTPIAAIDLSLSIDGTPKTGNFTNYVEVKVPVPAELSSNSVEVKYVDSDGNPTSETFTITSCSDGVLTFQTNHFSKYVIIEKKNIVAMNKDTGTRYTDFPEACSEATSGQTVVMLQDIVNTNYSSGISVTLGAGMILDGNGHKISGNISVKCNTAGATIQNVRFIGIHNNKTISSSNINYYGFDEGSTGDLTALYAKELTGTLVVTNCVFDGTDWDSIQITPKDGSVIYICNNVFSDNGKIISPTGHSTLRQIHIQSSQSGADFKVTIKNNKFNTGYGLNQTALEVYFPTDENKVDISGNYISNLAVCIHPSDLTNKPIWALPLMNEDMTAEIRPAGYKAISCGSFWYNCYFILDENDLSIGDYKINYDETRKAISVTEVTSQPQ